MRKSLVSGLIGLAALANSASADLVFPDSGVWSQPRIYQDSSEVPNYDSILPGTYSFKCEVKEDSGVDSSDNLYMQILGPENLNHDWGTISLNAGSSSLRQKTETLNQLGDYTLKFNLGSGESIQRDFAVIPEPENLGLFVLGGVGAYFLRKKKKI